MAYPNELTEFSAVPEDYPSSYSELTDPFLVWNCSNRTLTESNSLTNEEHNKLMATPTAEQNADAVWNKEL